MGFKINEENYQIYTQVLAIIWRHQLKSINPNLADVSSPILPTEVLGQWESKSKKLALRGLRVGLSDVLTNINHHKKSTLEEMDIDLKNHGLPTLNTLIAMVRGHVQKAIKRGSVKNLKEYYIFKELLDDTISDITEEERIMLGQLMSDYEKSIK